MPEDDEQKENTIMGGIFGVASKSSCILDLFFGIDYHSHLGTRRGGMAVYDKKRGFDRVIHNIENAPFRTKFESAPEEAEVHYLKYIRFPDFPPSHQCHHQIWS